MSVELITETKLRCRCELPNCSGAGKPWIARSAEPPKHCLWCRSILWNGQPDGRRKGMTEDQRREYERRKQAESRSRKKELIEAQKNKAKIVLPKPKKVRSQD